MNTINKKETVKSIIQNSHHSWLNVKDITANLEEAGFVVEETETQQQAFIFVSSDTFKKIAYNPYLTKEQQKEALLSSYGYYEMQPDKSRFMLTYITDINKEQKQKVDEFINELTTMSLVKEMAPEQFAMMVEQDKKILVKSVS